MPIVQDIFGINSSKCVPAANAGEVFALWQHLVMRYDIQELTDIFQNFANDTDLKLILTVGLSVVKQEIELLENQMDRLGIPLPPRPPKSINTPSNTEVLRDELMFRIIYKGIQEFLSEHIRSILNSEEKQLRDLYIKLEKKELSYYVKMTDYGKAKGWLFIPPGYKTP